MPTPSGVTLLSSSTLQYAAQPHVRLGFGYNSADFKSGLGWGLGFAQDDGYDVRFAGKSIAFGWEGAAGVTFKIFPQADAYMIGTTAMFFAQPGAKSVTPYLASMAVSLLGGGDEPLSSIGVSSTLRGESEQAAVRESMDQLASTMGGAGGARIPGGGLLVGAGGDVFSHYSGSDVGFDGVGGIGETNRPVDASTLYKMYSMTKVVTAVAGLLCMEDGLFQLTDPVALYIPEFANQLKIQVEECDDDNMEQSEIIKPPGFSAEPGVDKVCYTLVPAAPATVYDIFTFSSGYGYSGFPGGDSALDDAWIVHSNLKLRDGVFDGAEATLSFNDAFAACVGLDDSYWTECADAIFSEADADLEQWTAKLARVPLMHDPGAQWYYGIDADILGRLVFLPELALTACWHFH
jgi:CubicO group peptidase (beta-lactamase class C family)